MDITYLGHSSFKIRTRTGTVITDPFDSAMVGLPYPKQEADIVCVSHAHHDHDDISRVSGIKRILSGPGEYEIAGISILGFGSFHDSAEGRERGKNTIYVIEAEGLRACHLGDLGHTLTSAQVGGLGKIDVLFIPVGGTYTIGPKEAALLVSEISPTIIIPMHYQTEGLVKETFGTLLPASDFVKEVGCPTETLERLSIKKEEENFGQKIVVLQRK